MSLALSPISPRIPQDRNWTVSSDFGDTLLVTMREHTKSGGSILRSSLLTLPTYDASDPDPSHSGLSPGNSKPTMKTRVAVRDKSPHRFQVVPLREVGPLMLPAQDATKTRKVDSTTSKPDARSEDTGRIRTPSEQNRNFPVGGDEAPLLTPPRPSDLDMQTQLTSTRHMLLPSTHEDFEKIGPKHAVPRHRSSELTPRSILRSKNGPKGIEPNSIRSHFKSPSLGNLLTTSSLSHHYEYKTLSQTTSHKRTNALSIDNPEHSSLGTDKSNVLPRRRPSGDVTSKRHAIYTQSLYVPHDEEVSFAGKIRSDNTLKRPAALNSNQGTYCLDSGRPCIPEISAPNTPLNPGSRHRHGRSNTMNSKPTALELKDFVYCARADFPPSTFIQRPSLDLQSSASSVPMIQIRPLTCSGLSTKLHRTIGRKQVDESEMNTVAHHPIIKALLAELNEMMVEWCV